MEIRYFIIICVVVTWVQPYLKFIEFYTYALCLFSVCELYLNLKTILGDSILLLYWLRILYVDYIISILTVLSFIFQEIRMLFFFKLPTGSGMEGVHHL